MMPNEDQTKNAEGAGLPEREQRLEEEIRIFPDHITLHFVKDRSDKLAFIQETLAARQFDPKTERALVFVHRRKDAEDHATAFVGWQADYYHAGRDSSEKQEIAKRFEDADVAVLFATKAFGMGVDIKTIRYVFHMMPPHTLRTIFRRSVVLGATSSQPALIFPIQTAISTMYAHAW